MANSNRIVINVASCAIQLLYALESVNDLCIINVAEDDNPDYALTIAD